MGFGPVGLAVVVVAEAAQHGEEAGLGAAQVIDGVGASPAKVANGFVHTVGDVDCHEVVGAKVFGELHGVTFVGFDAITGFRGNEGWGDDIAPDPHLVKASGDPETTAAGFVAYVEIGELALLVLGDAPHGPFKGVLGGFNRAVVAGLGIAVRFQDGDDSFFFMNVESEVECLWCV